MEYIEKVGKVPTQQEGTAYRKTQGAGNKWDPIICRLNIYFTYKHAFRILYRKVIGVGKKKNGEKYRNITSLRVSVLSLSGVGLLTRICQRRKVKERCEQDIGNTTGAPATCKPPLSLLFSFFKRVIQGATRYCFFRINKKSHSN
jgi:hypothetical protein